MPRPRRTVLLATLVLVCGVLSLAAAARVGEGSSCAACDSPPPSPEQSIQAESAESQLAQKHAPIVYIRDQREACDTRGSPYVPVPVEFVFDVEQIVLRRHQNGRTTEEARAPNSSDLYAKDDTYFLDFPGNPKRPGCVYERDFLARYGDYTPTAYAHITTQEGRDGIALQYWLFYYFNHWNNTHEGDWEMIQLTFDGPTASDALLQEPNGVGYSQHGGGERSDWDDSKLTTEGPRPVIFAAAGANANQFEPNIILGRGEKGTGFGCDDASPPSRRVPLDVKLMEEPADASSEYAWLAFDGRWGERAPWEFNGPTGPNDKRAWTQPFSWQEDLRPSSIIVPTGSTVGPNAVNFFCDVIWYMSAPFAQVFRLPRAVILTGLVAGIAALGFIATRTTYRPIVAAPLRGRRRFGQVLSSAARTYRTRAALFFGIGLIYVPAGFIGSLVQWLIFRTPYEDTVAGFFSDNVAVKLIIALSIGNVASSVAYWFVTVAAIAALVRIERRQDNSPLADYGDVLRQFTALVIPRLKALGIVLLLAVSVIGIPWALRHAVRWAFIEEAILLDRTPSGHARRVSARTVDGHWWHTFGCLVALSLLGFLAGPIVAFGLLLFSGVAVSTVNLASSMVYAAVTPFVAICLAFLYFDLSAQAAGDDVPQDHNLRT